jgi:hypothetical protein
MFKTVLGSFDAQLLFQSPSQLRLAMHPLLITTCISDLNALFIVLPCCPQLFTAETWDVDTAMLAEQPLTQMPRILQVGSSQASQRSMGRACCVVQHASVCVDVLSCEPTYHSIMNRHTAHYLSSHWCTKAHSEATLSAQLSDSIHEDVPCCSWHCHI